MACRSSLIFPPLTGLALALTLSACTPVQEQVIAVGPSGVQYIDVTDQVAPQKPSDINSYVAGLGEVIPGPELIDMLSGRTAYGGMNQRQGQWAEFTSPDGRAIFRNREGALSDGSWWVSGNQACFSYASSSGAYCNFAVRVNGRVQYVLTNGRMDYYVTSFGAGDSEQLSEALLLRNGR